MRGEQMLPFRRESGVAFDCQNLMSGLGISFFNICGCWQMRFKLREYNRALFTCMVLLQVHTVQLRASAGCNMDCAYSTGIYHFLQV